MVDRERLARVRDDVQQIRRLSADHDLTRDDVALGAVKYAFVTVIEGCVRAAAHVISSEGLGMPASNAAAVRALGGAGIVPAGVAEPVARAVGFRNVLVDEYAEVDDAAVRANVALLADLDAYAAAVTGWASRHP